VGADVKGCVNTAAQALQPSKLDALRDMYGERNSAGQMSAVVSSKERTLHRGSLAVYHGRCPGLNVEQREHEMLQRTHKRERR
jgi:hypothetical protein